MQWPLGLTVKKGFLEAGVTGGADANSGQSSDLARWTENWRDGIRQPAGLAYDMSKVHVMTNTLVHKVLLEKTGTSVKAKGVEKKGAKEILARKEVIVCCRALRTHMILMHSGIGEPSQLKGARIESLIDSPHVGKNLYDRKYSNSRVFV